MIKVLSRIAFLVIYVAQYFLWNDFTPTNTIYFFFALTVITWIGCYARAEEDRDRLYLYSGGLWSINVIIAVVAVIFTLIKYPSIPIPLAKIVFFIFWPAYIGMYTAVEIYRNNRVNRKKIIA